VIRFRRVNRSRYHCGHIQRKRRGEGRERGRPYPFLGRGFIGGRRERKSPGGRVGHRWIVKTQSGIEAEEHKAKQGLVELQECDHHSVVHVFGHLHHRTRRKSKNQKRSAIAPPGGGGGEGGFSMTHHPG
jgi:hypothetical protein